MTSEMIERVAIAIWDENQKSKLPDERRFTWAEYEEGRNQDTFRNIARAAIAAMREPTPEMALAGAEYADSTFPTATYRAMIDEALKDPA